VQAVKIVIFGLSVSSTWGNGHATLWRGLCKALTRRRHRVVFFERDVPYYADNRDLHELPGGTLILYRHWDEVRGRAQSEVDDADATIVTSYCPDGIAASGLATSGRGLSAFYDLDTPVTLARHADGGHVSYVPSSGLCDFDLVLSFTGGLALELLRSRLGAKRVAALYGSVDPEVHHPADAKPHYAADLSYLGTYSPDRQAALRSLLLEPAACRPEKRFVMGGAQYPADFPWLPNLHFVRHLPSAEHPSFFSSSRWTLNVTRAVMAELGWCPSGRLFEAAACGAPILTDYWEGLETFFTPGQQIVIAAESTDVLMALELDEAERLRIAARARERTLDQHNAQRRADELIAHLDQATRTSRLPEAAEM
jgi:spore maturation protein CgeB